MLGVTGAAARPDGPYVHRTNPEDEAIYRVQNMKAGFMRNYRPPINQTQPQVDNFNRGGAAYDQQMRQYGSRTGSLGIPYYGRGVGPGGQGYNASELITGAGRPEQAVDGRYAVNPSGLNAMGGQYKQPLNQMAPVQGWRQGVAPSAEDMAINDAYQGKKQQYVNTQFANPKAAYERMAQSRARRMGIPIAGMDAAGVQNAIARGMDMRALRARGVDTSDPRVMRQFGQMGQQNGNQYAMQRFNNIMGGENPDIGKAFEALVDSGLPPAQIKERITGMFGSAAYNSAMEGYKNHQGMFGVDQNRQRMWNYMNPPAAAPGAGLPSWIAPTTEWSNVPRPPAPNMPPVPYDPRREGTNSSGDVWGGAQPSSQYNPQGLPGPWRSGYVFPSSPRRPMPIGVGRY
jgi:hypothetical protein